MIDGALTATLGGLAGGRAVYVVANWAYYGDHLDRALRLRDGGLSWHGGLAGGLVGLAVYCAVRQGSLRSMLDVLTPGVAVLPAFVWLGCFFSGCAHGIETYPGQGLLWSLSLDLADLHGIWIPRVAVQLLGAGWGALVLAAVALVRRRTHVEGVTFPFWLALYSAGSFGLGFLRADEVAVVAGWRVDQMVDLALAVVGVAVLVLSLIRGQGGEVMH